MSIDPAAASKQAAAWSAVYRHINSGMTVGLGSGSTSLFVVRALAERIGREKLSLRGCIATSAETAALARELGIDVVEELDPRFLPLDVTIDGADEADANLNLIKGGGGASMREKLVALASNKRIIVVHKAKRVATLGLTFPLPIVVIPYGWRETAKRVEQVAGRAAALRVRHGHTFVTDDGLYILDLVPGPIPDPAAFDHALKQITGVVDVGMFIGIANLLVVGHEDGRVEEFEAA
ncbi:MAG: ribose-5-phosphate isomerase RpiA [Capsulimonadaceae bacterium]|nr:ribose-5-phosphate isomerase RpiA [Capsulimonadaceae bacterium]